MKPGSQGYSDPKLKISQNRAEEGEGEEEEGEGAKKDAAGVKKSNGINTNHSFSTFFTCTDLSINTRMYRLLDTVL